MSVEKVDSLERLAASGLPVPSDRLYLNAKECEGPLPELSTLSGGSFLVRSAHPLEGQFSGGAFESILLRIAEHTDVRQIWDEILSTRDRIIELTQPAASLQIRRDLRHRQINGFNPQDMGIYLNKFVPSVRQLTILASRDGSLRVSYEAGAQPYSFMIPSDALVSKQLEKLLSPSIESPLINDLRKAQNLLGGSQEMELLLLKDGSHCFVQAKRVPEEGGQLDTIDEQEFQEGQTWYFQYPFDFTQLAREKADFIVWSTEQRARVLELPVLVVDEAGWVSNSINVSGSLFASEQNSVQFAAEFFNRNLKGGRWQDQLLSVLRDNYSELLHLAEQYPNYLLWYKTRLEDWVGYGLSAQLPSDVLSIREELAGSAQIWIRPLEKSPVQHHTVFGSIGPRQIAILVDGGELVPFPDRMAYDDSIGRRVLAKDFSKLNNLKTGDSLRVMLKPQRRKAVVSLRRMGNS